MSRYKPILIIAGLLLAMPVRADETHQLLPDAHAPAGVMNDHMHEAGSAMVGLRYTHGITAGDTLAGDHVLSDQSIADRGYSMRSEHMSMDMMMLDLMYAPTNWLTLMLMPQFMMMDMEMASLPPGSGGGGGGHGGHTGGHAHDVAGIGDTVGTALIRLYQNPIHRIHAGVGINAPTGSVWERDGSGNMMHYGMQLGSGTWDFLPSLTYTGRAGSWGWGAQASAVHRMENANQAGFRFGDQVQTTAWGSYRMLDWLSGSVRFQYTAQDIISGHFNHPHNHGSPPDLQPNYGGQFYDVGFGINTVVTEGVFAGHRLGVEWLQPVYQAVNGVQQAPTGTLYLNWSMAF